MKKIILSLFIGILFAACNRIPTMNQEIVNALDIQQLQLTDPGVEIVQSEQLKADFFYGNGSLYIADRKNNRVIAVDEDNKIFLEIGNLNQSVQNQSENFWEKELKNFVSQNQEGETSLKEKAPRATPRRKNRVKYDFQQIDRIIADFDENLYVVNYSSQGMEILKFDPDGKFLYFIGEEGRDNPKFAADAKILNFYISKDNGLWIKYYHSGMMKIRYYSSYGKNTLLFEEQEIEKGINAFLEKNESEFYRIEDIFPLLDSNKIAAVINIYKKEDNRFHIARKLFFEMNRDYNVEDYWKFSETSLQVFSINSQNQILCFSYLPKERLPILMIYDSDGSLVLEKKISLQRFNYHRLSILLTQHGDLMGAFLKKNIAYFVLWK